MEIGGHPEIGNNGAPKFNPSFAPEVQEPIFLDTTPASAPINTPGKETWRGISHNSRELEATLGDYLDF